MTYPARATGFVTISTVARYRQFNLACVLTHC